MANDTNFLLAEMEDMPASAGPTFRSTIKRAIRSYLSERRAEQDRDLLSEANPSGTYLVLSIHHIDD
jgi:metal-responsive CopG/Arc/MetJ family transcriptional regulator